MIDPACGTMHFGHYAFEVFTAIYQDYRDLYDGPSVAAGGDGEAAALSDAEIPPAITSTGWTSTCVRCSSPR